MVVVVLPMVSFACKIFFSILSFSTLNSINVEVSVPLVFLWMPSVTIFLFFSSSYIFCMLRLVGIWLMQSHGLVSALPARCTLRVEIFAGIYFRESKENAFRGYLFS